jgi:hypothetical protein
VLSAAAGATSTEVATTMTAVTTTGKATITAAEMSAAVRVPAAGIAAAAAGMAATSAARASTTTRAATAATLMNSVAAHAQGSSGEERHEEQIAHDAIILASESKRSCGEHCASLRATTLRTCSVKHCTARLLPSSSAQGTGKLTDAGRMEKPA